MRAAKLIVNEVSMSKSKVPDSSAALIDIEKRVLWLATRIIHEANQRDGGEVKVGGHQASCASMVSIMTSLWFDHISPED